MFHPEDVQVKAGRPENDKTERQVKDFAEHTETDGCGHDESVLIEEVDKLRHKVHKLESDNSSLRANLTDKRRIEEESKDIRKQLEASKRGFLRDNFQGLNWSKFLRICPQFHKKTIDIILAFCPYFSFVLCNNSLGNGKAEAEAA